MGFLYLYLYHNGLWVHMYNNTRWYIPAEGRVMTQAVGLRILIMEDGF